MNGCKIVPANTNSSYRISSLRLSKLRTCYSAHSGFAVISVNATKV